MRKKVNVGYMIGAIVLAVILTFNITYVIVWNAFGDRISNLAAREATFSKISEISAYIDEFYIGEYDEKTLIEGIANGYLGALDDISSYYLTKEEAQARLSGVDSDYTGIGIVTCYDEENHGIMILKMPEGSSAQEHGLKLLDSIIAVDGVEVAKIGYESALEKIRGEEGTEVALTVYRQVTGERFNAIVRRGAIMTELFVPAKMLTETIGYLRLDNFDLGIADVFAAAYADLRNQGMESLVLDLRMNPGGYMDEMVKIADLFLDEETTIYKELDYSGNAAAFYASAGAETIPIVVLTNGFTAGGAEYFAAALVENGRASSVGAITAGIAYAQSSIELSDGSMLVLSTTEYLTPLGNSLKDIGFHPETLIPIDIDELYEVITLTDPIDRQLETAIEILKN